MRGVWIAVAVVFGSSGAVLAQEAGSPDGASAVVSAVTVRATAAPVIDGSSDDPSWAAARSYDGFMQFDPRVGAEPSLRSEFKVTFDEDHLYVFVRAHDPHPDSIMRALTRRDVRGPSDQITVFVDSYNDRRTGFEFSVNPDGVKRDFAIYNDGEEDSSWNGIWDVATTVDQEGWTAEFRIPLSQLRYGDASTHTFGFAVWRDIERFKERVAWPAYSPERSGLVSQFGQLEGLSGITSTRSLEMTPYLSTKNVTLPVVAGGFERRQNVSAGGDLKFRLTPNITLDATVNPDFGQVEADPAVLNLSAFETFVGERRPFFIEGTGLYRFALNCYIVVDCSTNEGLFYSRRIGRSPSLLATYGDDSTPTTTPIAGAAKITGRTSNGLSFGFMDAVTRHVEGPGDRTVEPRSNYAVLRVRQDLRGGEADVSLIGTAVNRSLDQWTGSETHASAYATGLSLRNRFADGNYEVAGSITASRVSGSPEAILQTQLGSVHYYQQPGDNLEVDPTRTSLSGHAEQLKFGKYGGGFTRFETSLVRQSAGFEVNDLGFLRRADRQNWSTWAALSFQDQTSIYRWAQLNANHWETWTTSGLRTENAWNFNGHMGLNNNWDIHGGATLGGFGNTFCDRCSRGGPALAESRGVFPWFGVNGDNRKSIVPSMWVNLWYTDEGASSGSSLSPSVSVRPSPRLQAEVGVNLSRDRNNTQWFGNFDDGAGDTHYTFAHLDQRTVSMNVRLNYTASPDLTFEFYGEPFVSSGSYSDFRELSASPGAEGYVDRFQTYSPPPTADTEFKFTQLRTNAVLRWEYLPGSTVFLVWAHGREGSTDRDVRPAWHRDLGNLFDLQADHTFLIKVAHWFSW